MKTNNKYMSLVMALLCVSSIGFTSCKEGDDTPNAPTIEIEEANIEEEVELCVEANIKAPGKTATVTVTVRSANGQTVKLMESVTGVGYIGVQQIPEFHKHFDIAGKGVVEGDVLEFTVTDAFGQVTTAKKSITEEEGDDHHHHE
ncbi:MAG: hypothetical protein K6A96_05230 [Prevotella sp.]|nr:hypothetical protein [Prevotella sp.]